MSLSTRDVDRVMQSLQKVGDLVEQGIVLSNVNAQYHFISLNEIKPEMLTEAANNAYEAAQSFARNAKLQVGIIRNATQGLFSIQDAGSNYNSGAAVSKKVRVVTTIEYELR